MSNYSALNFTIGSGDPNATSYSIPWDFQDFDDVEITRTRSEVNTTLVLDTDYTISGQTITWSPALLEGDVIAILRSTATDALKHDFSEEGTQLTAATVAVVFQQIFYLMQEISSNFSLSGLIGEANKLIGWNSAGTALENKEVDVINDEPLPSYVGNSGKFVKVNATADGLEYSSNTDTVITNNSNSITTLSDDVATIEGDITSLQSTTTTLTNRLGNAFFLANAGKPVVYNGAGNAFAPGDALSDWNGAGVVDCTTQDDISGTYARSGTTVTVTSTAHGLEVGEIIYCDFTSGGATDGATVIDTVPDANTFTCENVGSGTIASGNTVVLKYYSSSLRGNIKNVVDMGTGARAYNFTSDLPNTDYRVYENFGYTKALEATIGTNATYSRGHTTPSTISTRKTTKYYVAPAQTTFGGAATAIDLDDVYVEVFSE